MLDKTLNIISSSQGNYEIEWGFKKFMKLSYHYIHFMNGKTDILEVNLLEEL